MSEAPLISTKDGNVQADGLVLHIEWSFGPYNEAAKMPQWIKCREFYTDKETGDIVKDGAHVYSSVGVAGEAVAQTL